MSELRKRDITIRYVGIHEPNISSVRSAKEVARQLFYDWWEYRFGREPEIIDITVDGVRFKSIKETE